MLFGFVLFQKKGYVARVGFPESHTDLLKYARVFPMDENTVALAKLTHAALFTVGPVNDGYSPEELQKDSRFVANLAGRAA